MADLFTGSFPSKKSDILYRKLECIISEIYVEIRRRIILIAIFFPSFTFLSHWVFSYKVYNEAILKKYVVILFYYFL